LARGEADTACAEFEKFAASHDDFSAGYNLALAYLRAGRVVESAIEFERLLRRFSEERATNPFDAIRAHYYLGMAHEEAGHMDKAVEQYEEFLTIWRDADSEIGEVHEAKERLARLRQAG
jgi:tetratricopeptide (TPR) repeat protein